MYRAGCIPALKEYVEDRGTLVGGVALGIIIGQVIGVLVTCMLASSIRRKNGFV